MKTRRFWTRTGDRAASFAISAGGLLMIGSLVLIFGLIFSGIYALLEYGFTIPRLPRKSPEGRIFTIWVLLAAAGLVASVQLFGDARFRLPLLALLFAAQTFKDGGKSPARDRG